MTDFGPLIASPKSFILGAAAQLGIFITLFGAILLGFNGFEAAATAIIGGADGPTSIYVATKMGVDGGMLSAITVAAYSYMALIPPRFQTRKNRVPDSNNVDMRSYLARFFTAFGHAYARQSA